MFLLQERYPPIRLCTWQQTKYKNGDRQLCPDTVMWLSCRELPNLSASAGALTIHHHHVFKLPVVRRGFGKDRGKRPWHCPSPHPLQEQGATSPCPAPFVSKGSCTWRTWGAKGVWWLRYHQHKTDSLPPPPFPPVFSSPAQLITLYFIPGCHKPT